MAITASIMDEFERLGIVPVCCEPHAHISFYSGMWEVVIPSPLSDLQQSLVRHTSALYLPDPKYFDSQSLERVEFCAPNDFLRSYSLGDHQFMAFAALPYNQFYAVRVDDECLEDPIVYQLTPDFFPFEAFPRISELLRVLMNRDEVIARIRKEALREDAPCVDKGLRNRQSV